MFFVFGVQDSVIHLGSESQLKILCETIKGQSIFDKLSQPKNKFPSLHIVKDKVRLIFDNRI